MVCDNCFLTPCQCDTGAFLPAGVTQSAPEAFEVVLAGTETRSDHLQALIDVQADTDPRLDTTGTPSGWEKRLRWHVDQIPTILHTIRTATVPLRATKYDANKVQASKGDAPAPVNLNAVDDADDLWALIVPVIVECGEKLHARTPPVTTASWSHHGQVAGLPHSFTPRDARNAGWQVSEWLRMWAPHLEFTDVHDGLDDLFRAIRGLAVKWTGEVQPRMFNTRACTVCGEKRVGVTYDDIDGVEHRIAACIHCGAEYGSEPVQIELKEPA